MNPLKPIDLIFRKAQENERHPDDLIFVEAEREGKSVNAGMWTVIGENQFKLTIPGLEEYIKNLRNKRERIVQRISEIDQAIEALKTITSLSEKEELCS